MSNQYAPYNPEIESHLLACLIQYPESSWGEVAAILKDTDFSVVHRPIYSVIRSQLEGVQPVSTVILADKLKSYGIDASKLAGVEPYDYLWALSAKPVKKDEATQLLASIKGLTVRRELVDAAVNTVKDLKESPADKLSQMVGIVDRRLSAVNTEYYSSSDTVNLFDGMIDKIEEEGNNPLKEGESGFMGPFPSINETIGSLSYRGAFVVVGARTNVGKSSLSWFYNMNVAAKHNLITLNLDAAEMTPDELQYRQVCAMSNGQIPYAALENRQWRLNPKWVDLIRKDIWPRIQQMQKTGVYYKNIGNMTPREIINFIKRFYFNKVGRGNFLVINYDYLKGMDSMRSNVSEHQAIGSFVNDFKCLVTDEINACVWTSVQNNRGGITTKDNRDDEEHSGQMGLSDRIIQQSTHGFILRFKTVEEIALEGNKFGNLKLTCVKKRKLLGPRYQDMLVPVKLPNGKYMSNYFNLESRGFSYLDKGSLKDMIAKTGQGVIQMDESTGEKTVMI